MRQKCRKSVKCFANGCQRLRCLLTRLWMNSRTNATRLCLLLHPSLPLLHTFTGLGVLCTWLQKSHQNRASSRKMLCKMCAKVLGKYVSSSALTVFQMYLVSLPPHLIPSLKYFETLQCVAGEASWLCSCVLWLKCFYAVRLMCFWP